MFYSDLLKAVNGRVGYNADDPDRADNNVDWKLSFNSKPKKSLDLSMEKKIESEVKADVESKVEKTATKLKQVHGDGCCTTTWGFANDKMNFDGKGKLYDEDGWRVDIAAGGEVKQAKDDWKVTAGFDLKGSDLGGAKLGLNVGAETNKKSETKLKPKLNLEVADEFNLGVSMVHDTKTFTEIWPQLVWRPKDCADKSQYWARFDLTRSLAMAGCDQKLKDGIHHSFEAVYGWKDFKGLMGQPVQLRGGVEYTLSDQTQLNASGEWGESYSVQQEVEHKVDSHWTVAATQSFDSARVGGKVSPYHIGFSASYKL